MNKPLEGLRVLDLTHMLSGPYGAMILADLGAETIKVEPLHGEGTRKLLATDPKNSLDGMGAYYLTLNRNKKSVSIDLKSESGLQLFYELVKHADIVISNFAAGVPERLGIGYEKLSAVNPRIITCTVTGFGSDGPKCKRPAFDQVAQAMGGGMSITGTGKDQPVRAGIPIGDLGGGMFGVMGFRKVVKGSMSIFPCLMLKSRCLITWRPCTFYRVKILIQLVTRTLSMFRMILLSVQMVLW